MNVRWKRFGNDLINCRMAYDCGQRELARKLKMDKTTLNRAENGKPIAAPAFVFLCKWMGALPETYLTRKPPQVLFTQPSSEAVHGF